MNSELKAVCAEYEERWDQQMADIQAILADGGIPERDNLLMPIGPEAGALVHALITGTGCRTILELGTSFGYSALWLADAARQTGGSVVSVDMSAEKQRYAQSQLERLGLEGFVQFIEGDAVEIIKRENKSYDFVLLDLFAGAYIPAFDALLPSLPDGALIVADNMLFPDFSREEAEAYQAYVRSLPGIEAVLLDIGCGIDLATVRKIG